MHDRLTAYLSHARVCNVAKTSHHVLVPFAKGCRDAR